MGSCSFYIHNITQPGSFCNMQSSLALLNNMKGCKALFFIGKGDAMDTPITRAEHDEFCKRMETENQRLADEDKRLGRRVSVLEDTTRQMQALTTNVERLAVSMENMAKTQTEQAGRLDDLEAMDNLSAINANVEKLTTLLENSKETLERQEKRLEALEARDGEKWRQVTGYIITAITGIILGFIATHLGF